MNLPRCTYFPSHPICVVFATVSKDTYFGVDDGSQRFLVMTRSHQLKKQTSFQSYNWLVGIVSSVSNCNTLNTKETRFDVLFLKFIELVFHSVDAGPLASISARRRQCQDTVSLNEKPSYWSFHLPYSFGLVDLPQLGDVVGERIVRIGGRKESLDRQKHGTDLEGGTPLIWGKKIKRNLPKIDKVTRRFTFENI